MFDAVEIYLNARLAPLERRLNLLDGAGRTLDVRLRAIEHALDVHTATVREIKPKIRARAA